MLGSPVQEFLQQIGPDYYRSARLVIVREGVYLLGVNVIAPIRRILLWRLLIPPLETP